MSHSLGSVNQNNTACPVRPVDDSPQRHDRAKGIRYMCDRDNSCAFGQQDIKLPDIELSPRQDVTEYIPRVDIALGHATVRENQDTKLSLDAGEFLPGSLVISVYADGAPVSETTAVAAIGPSPDEELGAATTVDDQGAFRLEFLAPGLWMIGVKASEDGWNYLHPQSIRVRGGSTTDHRIDIDLIPGRVSIRDRVSGKALRRHDIRVDGPMDESFVERFEERYGEEPSSYAGYAYDILMMLDMVRSEVGVSPRAIRDRLAAIRDFPGVMGSISILPNRDASLIFRLMRVRGGEAVVYDREGSVGRYEGPP